ncbi:MAG: DNA-directed DNA polymerase [Candidatus Aenigmatarchaeota archaeon]
MEKFYLLDVDWTLDGDEPVIRLWGKTKNGKTIVVFDRSFRDYFYVEPKHSLSEQEVKDLAERISKIQIEGKKPEKTEILDMKLLGKPIRVIKVITKNPHDVQKIRDIVKEWEDVREEYEYAMTLHRKYLIVKGFIPLRWFAVDGEKVETNLNVDAAINAKRIEMLEEEEQPKLKILAFDIEMTEENGEEKIIMISIMDNAGYEVVLTYRPVKARGVEVLSDEKLLIERFLHIVYERNPDIICGYNTDRFDFPKLVERAERYKIPLKLGRDNTQLIFRRRGKISTAQIRGRVHIDLYDFVEHILSQTLISEVLTLDKVAQELLGVGKKPMKWKEISEAWKSKEGVEKLIKYCRWDSELTLDLADYLLPQIAELCKITGQTLFDVSRMTYSQMVEWLLIRRAYEKGEIACNRPKAEEIEKRKKAEPYAGAYVHMPKEGVHENIALFDFRSLYPSIIVSHNISPETLDCEHPMCKKNTVPENGHWFCVQKSGFIPEILNDLMKKRIDINKKLLKTNKRSVLYRQLSNRQFGLKILANAFYGYYGYAGSRWYSRICAQSITAWGRYYIRSVIRMVESERYEVLYGDTDSLFLKIKSERGLKRFLEKINATLPGVIKLELKDVYKRGIFIEAKTGFAAKKKYALLDKKGRLVIRGMETRRRDWAKIAKDTQEAVLEAILKHNSVKKAIEAVRERINALRKGKIKFDDIIIYTQLTKPLNQYEQIGPHVKAAQKALERGRPVGEGSVILYVITKGPGSISDKAEPAEDAKDYDPEYYIHHQVIPPALRILASFGVTEEDLLKERKEDQESLERFIKKK